MPMRSRRDGIETRTVLAGPGPSPHDCLAEMRAHHQALLTLCDRLERLADTLPDRADRAECLALSRVLPAAVVAAHRFEEQTFFPTARLVIGGDDALEATIARLRGEHREDDAFAEEVGETLAAWGEGTARHDGEALGYMLRGLFNQTRRHVGVEREALCTPFAAALAREENEPGR